MLPRWEKRVHCLGGGVRAGSHQPRPPARAGCSACNARKCRTPARASLGEHPEHPSSFHVVDFTCDLTSRPPSLVAACLPPAARALPAA